MISAKFSIIADCALWVNKFDNKIMDLWCRKYTHYECGFRDFRAKVLVKPGLENRKPIRDGYKSQTVCSILISTFILEINITSV